MTPKQCTIRSLVYLTKSIHRSTPIDTRIRTHPGPGLYNLGNTCFLNATLQCLAYLPPLAQFVLASERCNMGAGGTGGVGGGGGGGQGPGGFMRNFAGAYACVCVGGIGSVGQLTWGSPSTGLPPHTTYTTINNRRAGLVHAASRGAGQHARQGRRGRRGPAGPRVGARPPMRAHLAQANRRVRMKEKKGAMVCDWIEFLLDSRDQLIIVMAIIIPPHFQPRTIGT